MIAKKQVTLRILSFLLLTDVLETFAQFCFKKSALAVTITGIGTFKEGFGFLKILFASPFLWFALVAISGLFIIWSTLLSKIDLSVAVPIASFSYITVPLVSTFFLHEKISDLRWFGISFILLGVVLVSASTRRIEKP